MIGHAPPLAAPRPAVRLLFVAGLLPALATGCGGGDGGGTPGPGGGGPSGPSPALALSLSASSLSVEAGSQGQVTATVTGTGGFTGAVTLTVEGAPAGATPTAGTVSVGSTPASRPIDVSVAEGTPGGSHALLVRARASGVDDVTAALSLAITTPPPDDGGPGGGSEVRLDFTRCVADQQPLWFAYQDGSGPWTRVAGQGHVYTFDVGGDGGYAWHVQPSGIHITQAVLFAAAEIPAATIDMCPAGSATVTATVAGLSGSQLASVSLGGGTGIALAQNPSVQLQQVSTGTHDLVAWRYDAVAPGGASERGFIRRDVAVTDGGAVAVDFGGTESFAPASASVTFQGTDGHPFVPVVGYATGSTCQLASLYNGSVGTATQVNLRGVPADRQRATDLHQLTASVLDPSGTRIVQNWFHALGNRTVDAPPPIAPTVTRLSGPYLRTRTTVVVPAPYAAGNQGNVFAGYEAGGRRLQVGATLARAGGNPAVVDMPDFTGADGWDPTWAAPSGSAGQSIVQVTGANLPGQTQALSCADGGWLRSAQFLGQLP
jgi:hypothetical protein